MASSMNDILGVGGVSAADVSGGMATRNREENHEGFKPVQKVQSPVPAPQLIGVDTGVGAVPQLSYQDMFRMMNYKDAPETPEQRAAREKKERRNKVLGAIGEGISALSNLFFTTRNAPNMYDPTKGMSAQMRSRYDRLKGERDANERYYNEGMIRMRQLDEAKRASDRNYMQALREFNLKQQQAEAKAERDQKLFELQLKLEQGKIDQQTAKARAAEIEAAYAEKYQQGRIAVQNSQIKRNEASAAASGRSHTKEFQAWDEQGNVHYFSTKEAADSFARQHGTYADTWSVEDRDVTKDAGTRNEKTTSTRVEKTAGGYAQSPEQTKKSKAAEDTEDVEDFVPDWNPDED